MHSRRIACFVLGLWLAGGFFMAWMATQNFRSVDRIFNQGNPTALLRLKTLGGTEGRELLRYQVSEQNRFYFAAWETTQIFLGGFFFFFLLFATDEGKLVLCLALFMETLLLAQRFVLTPAITSLGRTLDFVPPAQAQGEHVKFMVLHSAYVGVELAKWALGLVMVLVLVLQRAKRSKDIRQQINPVNKANYGHVNR